VLPWPPGRRTSRTHLAGHPAGASRAGEALTLLQDLGWTAAKLARPGLVRRGAHRSSQPHNVRPSVTDPPELSPIKALERIAGELKHRTHSRTLVTRRSPASVQLSRT